MNRRLAAECCTGELTTAIRDYLVHVHVELGTAAGHPDMQRKHFVMLARENLITDSDDQAVDPIVEPLARVIGVGRSFFQDSVRSNHLSRDQIPADAEMLERALGLRSPKFIGRYVHLAKAVGFRAHIAHWISPKLFENAWSPGGVRYTTSRNVYRALSLYAAPRGPRRSGQACGRGRYYNFSAKENIQHARICGPRLRQPSSFRGGFEGSERGGGTAGADLRVWSALRDPLQGKTSLSKVVWGYGLLGSIVYGAIELLLDPGNEFVMRVYTVGGLLFSVYVTLATYRCAGNCASNFWARMARISALLSLLLLPVFAYLALSGALSLAMMGEQ
jgi:hypothetical protein